MDAARRQKALSHGRVGPIWRSEPLLGGYYEEEEIEAVVRAIRDSQDPMVGFGFVGPEIEAFEAEFAAYCGARDAVSINGAGTGLDMALMCLDLQPEDEVIVPSVNFRAGLMAVIGQRARLVLGEVDPRTFCLDPEHVERLMSPRTRAIMPTHMNGLAAPIDAYEEVARRHPHPVHGPAKVIGDAARACGARYRGAPIGAGGWMTVFSFHTQKLMTTLGEGGAVTTNDETAAKRLRAIRQFGSGMWWGSNFKMTKVQAAVGRVQLRKLDRMLAERRRVAEQRNELLHGIPFIELPYEPPECRHTYYLYTMLVPREWAGARRDRLMQVMRERYELDPGIYNRPVHVDHTPSLPLVQAHTQGQSLPRSEELGERIVALSIHPRMSEAENEYLCAALWEAVEQVAREDVAVPAQTRS